MWYKPNHTCCVSSRNNRANTGTENPKTLKILPSYRKYTII